MTGNLGTISDIRAALTSNKNLAALCRRLDIGRFVGDGREPAPGGYVLASVMEALLGAVYIDSSKDTNVLRHVMTKLRLNIHAKTKEDVPAKTKEDVPTK